RHRLRRRARRRRGSGHRPERRHRRQEASADGARLSPVEGAGVAAPDARAARRKRLRAVLTAIMIGIGVLHFVVPDVFTSIVPAYLPAPRALVLVSGVFEILGGVGLQIPRVRRAASYGLVALYISVFPANVNMVVHPEL